MAAYVQGNDEERFTTTISRSFLSYVKLPTAMHVLYNDRLMVMMEMLHLTRFMKCKYSYRQRRLVRYLTTVY